MQPVLLYAVAGEYAYFEVWRKTRIGYDTGLIFLMGNPRNF